MHDQARLGQSRGREHPAPTDEAYERAQAEFAALLHEEVIPVITRGHARLEAAVAALIRGSDGEHDAVVATTAALGELRSVEHRLRQVLEAALESDPDPDLVRQLMAFGRRSGTVGRFSFDLHDSRTQDTPRSIERALLHIGVEALENTARHAGATQVRVRLADRHGGVELTVADNGTGVGHTARRADQLGLRLMDRRAGSVGGWVRVEPGLVGGTIVTCWLPIGDDRPSALDESHSAAS
jgi:signal transduction histidine kinase